MRLPYKDDNAISTYLTHPLAITLAAVIGFVLVIVPVFFVVASGPRDADAQPRPNLSAAPQAAQVIPEQTTSGPSSSAITVSSTAPKMRDTTVASKRKAAPKSKMIAFYTPWGDEGYRSLVKNAEHIDVLMPMWYHLGSNGRLVLADPKDRARVMKVARANGIKVMPIVNNYDKSTETWNAPAMSRMLAKPALRKRLARNVVNQMAKSGYSGVNIDFESFTEKDRALLVAFMNDVYPLAKKRGLEVSMDVIVGSKTYNHAALAKHVDYLIPMMYDEHWKTSPAGPIASQHWYEKTLSGFLRQVPANKVVVGVGTYTYDWKTSGGRASSMTWSEAIWKARASRKPIRLDLREKNSTYWYKAGGSTRRVWMLDAASAFNQMKAGSEMNVRGYAVWRLGAEDPALWNVVPSRDALDASVAGSLEGAKRSVSYDEETGLISGQVLRP